MILALAHLSNYYIKLAIAGIYPWMQVVSVSLSEDL